MPFIPWVSSTFPSPTVGPYKGIGYAALDQPAHNPISLPSPRLPSGEPALALAHSAYAVYYPTHPVQPPPRTSRWAAPHPTPSVPWLPEPAEAYISGYQRFLGNDERGFIFHLARIMSGRLRMPVIRNAPLLPPAAGHQYPLVIFSHGLAGTRNTYSHFCSALASEGYIVLAVEHRDGSSPCVLRATEPALPLIRFRELQWDGVAPTDMLALRGLQLDHRVREVYEAYATFGALVGEGSGSGAGSAAGAAAGSGSGSSAGDSESVFESADASIPSTSGTSATSIQDSILVDGLDRTATSTFLSAFRGAVDMSSVILAGHSFGGGTMLRLVQSIPPAGYSHVPASRVVALDPWVEPFRTAASVPPHPTTPPPALVINSDHFSNWTGQFPELVDMVKRIRATLVSIVGIGHQGFSDFALFNPRYAGGAQGQLRTVHNLTLPFIMGALPAHAARHAWSASSADEVEAESEGEAGAAAGSAEGDMRAASDAEADLVDVDTAKPDTPSSEITQYATLAPPQPTSQPVSPSSPTTPTPSSPFRSPASSRPASVKYTGAPPPPPPPATLQAALANKSPDNASFGHMPKGKLGGKVGEVIVHLLGQAAGVGPFSGVGVGDAGEAVAGVGVEGVRWKDARHETETGTRTRTGNETGLDEELEREDVQLRREKARLSSGSSSVTATNLSPVEGKGDAPEVVVTAPQAA